MAYVDIGGYSYSTGAYGSNDFGSANFQTVVTASATTDASAIRIRLPGSIAVISSSSSTCDAEKIHQGDGSSIATSAMVASGAISVTGSAALTASASITSTCNRVRLSDASLTSTLVVSCNAREKWEPINKVDETWTEIA